MFDQPFKLDAFPTDLRLQRIDPACNTRRFYRLSVQRDLFGKSCLIREWGRIGCLGKVLIEPHDDERSAITALGLCCANSLKAGVSLSPDRPILRAA